MIKNKKMQSWLAAGAQIKQTYLVYMGYISVDLHSDTKRERGEEKGSKRILVVRRRERGGDGVWFTYSV